MAVEYFTIPELGEDKPMFVCSRRQATLQVSACAKMWDEANTKNAPERLERCRGCELGAEHAGAGEISGSPLYGSKICARCHRSGFRLVGGHICVSCWNREREYLIGRNAKGAAPKLHPPIYQAAARVLAGDQLKTVKIARCTSPDEVVVKVLRDEAKRVLFSFSPSTRVSWIQQELPF